MTSMREPVTKHLAAPVGNEKVRAIWRRLDSALDQQGFPGVTDEIGKIWAEKTAALNKAVGDIESLLKQ
jgi:hypothetical protein